MKPQLRIGEGLFKEMFADLRRPHPFAMERVGFIAIKGAGLDSAQPILVAAGYQSVPNSLYVPDTTSGACINGEAIRNAMQWALDGAHGLLHVHLHEFPGRTWFSTTDMETTQRLTPSFKATVPSQAHGAVIFGENSFRGLVWLPGNDRSSEINMTTIVGNPSITMRLK